VRFGVSGFRTLGTDSANYALLRPASEKRQGDRGRLGAVARERYGDFCRGLGREEAGAVRLHEQLMEVPGMTHEEKVEFLLNELSQRGVSKYTVAPPLYRILWRLGLEAKPPHFASFWSLTFTVGAFFAIAWGIFMWLFFWQGTDFPAVVGVSTSVIAGLLFGMTIAGYYRSRARRLALPRWESYPT
jgi:uncharacterized protein DUF6404